MAPVVRTSWTVLSHHPVHHQRLSYVTVVAVLKRGHYAKIVACHALENWMSSAQMEDASLLLKIVEQPWPLAPAHVVHPCATLEPAFSGDPVRYLAHLLVLLKDHFSVRTLRLVRS